jgi:hypothetical protein
MCEPRAALPPCPSPWPTLPWCLRWDHTLLHHGPDGMHMRGMRSEDMDAIVPQITVENATCIKPENMEMIKGKILEHHHSYEAFDTRLKLHLMLDPLSYSVDMEVLTRRSGGTRWRWQPVEELLRGQGKARAMCILAGKSHRPCLNLNALRMLGVPPFSSRGSRSHA